ncbi:MAG: sugar transferase [Marichromatium sp.]|uniref:sugar transferase n=1 Tax=Marichromatium sp. PS1 TaxID=3138932 RepID=UPI001B0C48A0|nr:sugar transferase [Marichromatium sp.]
MIQHALERLNLFLGARVGGQRVRWFVLALVVTDLGCLALSLWLGCLSHRIGGGGPVDGATLGLVGMLLGALVFERVGLYRYEPSMMRLVEIRKIIRAVVILALVLTAFAFYTGEQAARLALLHAMGWLLVTLLGARALVYRLQQSLYSRRFNVSRVLIVGAGEAGRMLYKHIREAPELGYWVSGFYDEDRRALALAGEAAAGPEAPALIAEADALRAFIEREQVTLVLISTPIRSAGECHLQQLMRLTEGLAVRICFMPYLSGYFAKQIQFMDINGIPMVTLGAIRPRPAEQISKRLLDLTLAGAALLLLAPLMIAIALWIRRDSPGPVLFVQERVGKDGARFPMYKFRTMHLDSPRFAYSPTVSDDPRITRAGRFLRRTSLDELPQLFNVLEGSMSLVGPRPEMPFIVEQEYEEIHRERLRVKPGITGVWQISGDRDKQIHENISYDLFYVENRSLLLDAIILVRTLLFAVSAMRTC